MERRGRAGWFAPLVWFSGTHAMLVFTNRDNTSSYLMHFCCNAWALPLDTCNISNELDAHYDVMKKDTFNNVKILFQNHCFHDDIGNVSSLQHFTPSVLGEAKVQTFPVVLKQNMKMKAMK